MPIIKSVDPRAASEWLANNEAIIVDVREPGEYESMHIVGAKLIPIGVVATSELPELKNKKLIMHCQFGRRGGMACEKLLSMNPALDIYNLEGGISAWEKEGLHVERSESTVIAIDRQVQITIGSGVLIGLILGYGFNQAFFFISAFFGAGLLYAGISGSCGLAVIMSKMPWNIKKKSD